LPLAGFFNSLAARFARPVESRDRTFDPAPPFLFEAREMTTPCDPVPPGRARLVGRSRGPVSAPFVCKRSEHLAFSAMDMPELVLDVDQTRVSIAGADADGYDVRFCAQARGPSENETRQLLEHVTLARTGGSLKVRKPKHSFDRAINAWLRIAAPRHRPVTVNGSYSYTEIFGMDAWVRVVTTHARVKLLGVAGDVSATAHVGVVDFAGDSGRIRLNADGEIGEINLKLTAPRFEGTLEATAEAAIRVLLSPAFESSFEAVVDRPERFVCCADIAPQIRRHDREGRAVFAYGSGIPDLRFVSHGVLVIDSGEQPIANRQ
jgi:hypothetical protein